MLSRKCSCYSVVRDFYFVACFSSSLFFGGCFLLIDSVQDIFFLTLLLRDAFKLHLVKRLFSRFRKPADLPAVATAVFAGSQQERHTIFVIDF